MDAKTELILVLINEIEQLRDEFELFIKDAALNICISVNENILLKTYEDRKQRFEELTKEMEPRREKLNNHYRKISKQVKKHIEMARPFSSITYPIEFSNN